MMSDRGEILGNLTERMEERSYIHNEETRQEVKKDCPIESNLSRQNFEDAFVNHETLENRNRGIALSERQTCMRLITLFVCC